MLFHRKRSRDDDRQFDHAGLVESLLGADEIERKRVLLVALQSGELRKSEVADLLRLVERLEAFSDGTAWTEPGGRNRATRDRAGAHDAPTLVRLRR